ncbi:MAG: hypothetical protein K9G41_00970 [Flavobacteriales bacterium]|nr:hypothetical protein [Flavobacteriales bacterium]
MKRRNRGLDGKVRFVMKMTKAWPYGLIFLIVYMVSGLIESGFHMMEDHEIMANHLLFKQAALDDYVLRVWNESGNRISRGLNVYLGLFSAMFGSRWWMWHTLVLTLMTLALHQFQSLGRTLGLSKVISFVLPLMLVVGTPTELMTRLATIESVSLLIAGILLNRIANGKHDWKTLGLLFLLFFTKESFVLLAPFLVVFSYFCQSEWNKSTTLESKGQHYFSLGVFGICALFAGAFLVVDTTNSEADYILSEPTAVVDNLISYFNHVWQHQWLASTPLPYFIVLAILYFLVYVRNKGGRWFWSLFAIGMLCILAQLVLFSSVGYAGRYLIPSLIVFFVIVAIGIASLRESNVQKSLIASALILIFCIQSVWSRNMISEYIDSGKAIQELIRFVAETRENEGKVVLVGDPLVNIEMFDAVIKYISFRTGNELIDVKIVPTKPNTKHFSELAEIYDPNALKRFEKGFQDHYYERIVKACPDSFQLVVFIGERTDFESVCPLITTEKPALTVGKSWYLFRVIVKAT